LSFAVPSQTFGHWNLLERNLQDLKAIRSDYSSYDTTVEATV